MNAKHIAFLSLLIAAAALVGMPSRATSQPAPAAPAGQSRIATANPSKVFFGMKEKNDVVARLKQDVEELEKQNASRRQKVADLKSAMELLKPDAPQYEEANRAFMTGAIEHKNWLEVSQAQAARNEKMLTKMLFDKITTTIAEIAKERGIDLVVAEQPAFNIERMTSEQLTQAMAQRQVLYTSASMDLTNDVITRLDDGYNAAKK